MTALATGMPQLEKKNSVLDSMKFSQGLGPLYNKGHEIGCLIDRRWFDKNRKTFPMVKWEVGLRAGGSCLPRHPPPRLLSCMTWCDLASSHEWCGGSGRWGLMDHACHVIHHRSDSRFWSWMASYDEVSMVYRLALSGGLQPAEELQDFFCWRPGPGVGQHRARVLGPRVCLPIVCLHTHTRVKLMTRPVSCLDPPPVPA